jgi:lysozyme
MMEDVLDCVIDVSHAQGDIHWPAIAADGITVACIKAVEGRSFQDPMFWQNMVEARAAGLMAIPYDFLRPGYASEQFGFFRRMLGLGPGMLVMLDWEGRASDTCTPAEVEDIGASIRSFSNRDPLLYRPIFPPRPMTAKMTGWPQFVPDYPRPVGSFAELTLTERQHFFSRIGPGALFGQYTETGTVAGIDGPVDRSVFLGTKDELDAWLKDGTMPARFQPAPQPVPQPEARVLMLTDPMMVGEDVRELQQRLWPWFPAIAVDGIFGMQTQSMLRIFQEAKRLTVDGMARWPGGETWAALTQGKT